jgi:hypothetical protein
MLVFNKIARGLFIFGVACVVAYMLVTPTGAFWSGMGITVMIMLALTKGELEKMLPWFIFSLAFVHLAKRALFLGEGAPVNLYYQMQAVPVFLMAWLLITALRRFGSIPLRFSDYLVASYFLFGLGLTLWKSIQSGDMMEAVISVAQHSSATLCYYVGRTLARDAWSRIWRPLSVCFVLVLTWAVIQLSGPTEIDIRWAIAMAHTSSRALCVVIDFYGGGVFRLYSTFADPLQFGLFVTFLWSLTEAYFESKGRSLWARLCLRGLYFGCLCITMSRAPLLAGVGMCAFAWILGRRGAGHPVLVFSGFFLAFVGVVVMTQFLLTNVITANWLPTWGSKYLARLFDIGTLTQRGYAVDEFLRAIQEYGWVGAGWKEQRGLTSIGGVSGRPEFESHNGVVNLIVTTGAIGVLLVLSWFGSWLRLVYAAIHRSRGVDAYRLRWGAAMILGYASTIFFSGQGFLNDFFWLMVGWTTTMAASVTTTSAKPIESAPERGAP